MIFDTINTASKKVKLYDAQGVEITTCFRYNTKTREAELYLTGKKTSTVKHTILTKKKKTSKPGQHFSVLKIKVKIPGSYIVVDGVKY